MTFSFSGIAVVKGYYQHINSVLSPCQVHVGFGSTLDSQAEL